MVKGLEDSTASKPIRLPSGRISSQFRWLKSASQIFTPEGLIYALNLTEVIGEAPSSPSDLAFYLHRRVATSLLAIQLQRT